MPIIYCDNLQPPVVMYARDMVDEPTFKMQVHLEKCNLSEEECKVIQGDHPIAAKSHWTFYLQDVDGENIADMVARAKSLGMRFKTPEDEQNFMNSSGDFFMTRSNDPIPVYVSFSPTPSS